MSSSRPRHQEDAKTAPAGETGAVFAALAATAAGRRASRRCCRRWRLALAAAAGLAGAVPPGTMGAVPPGAMGAAPSGVDVAWVELAPLDDPRVIAPTMAASLGIPETPGVDRSWLVPSLEPAHATRLFEERARLVAPSFAVTAANRQAVAQVCARVDGLPLAIALAAARMRVLSVRQLAERLDDVLGVLTGGARSAPPRHQALRATLDWSHELLNGQERAVFRRLAVFADGFTLPAAERVVAFGGIREGEVLDLLARLADKSLLQVDGERYRLLATIREYAADKLARAGERDQARRAHLDYYTEFTEEAGDCVEHAVAPQLETELDRLDAERANLRAATGAPPRYRARALYGSGRLAHLQCDYEPAVRRLDAALLLFRELGDDTGTAACLQSLGSVAREQGRYARGVGARPPR
jgi:tetratricopeptide (TPR) repeat protein